MVLAQKRLKKGFSVEVRDAQISDVDEIWDVFNMIVDEGIYLPVFSQVKNKSDKRSWYYELISAGDFCLVAVLKGHDGSSSVIGQVTIETSTEWDGIEHVGILGILVHPDYRNIGVGQALLDEACKEAKRRGKSKIILSVFHTNPRAIALYKKVGFEIVGVRKCQFWVNDAYVDEVLMEKFLSPMESFIRPS
ncbi:MAG: GNAT family N-acetyltransferase [Candidatus Lokiarchaeota archaeon]|nr:GNAT family N-acetyltransferase [Candidatus Lokiarchaeota archaeon]